MATRDIELVPSLDHVIPNDTSLFKYADSKIWKWEHAYLKQVANVVNNQNTPAQLIEDGCKFNESSAPDCTKACHDPTMMFENPATLWNCMTLATLAVLTRHNHVMDNGTQYINKTQAFEANKTLNFGDIQNFDFPFANYRPCALESCILFGGCEANITKFLTIPINNSQINELASSMSGFYCRSARPGIDQDIAGPGIIIAYIIQFALVFFFAVSYTIITDWMVIPVKDTNLNTTLRPGFPRAIESSITALQETQASFLVTIASAAIATFLGKKGTGMANIRTVASWITNETIMKGLATAGSYPLLLIQLVLNAGGNRSWYTLLFIVVNGILVYVLHLPNKMDSSSLLPHFQDVAKDLTSCGKNPGPRTFCREAIMADNGTETSRQAATRQFKVNSAFPYPVYALSAILVLDWAAHTIYYRHHCIFNTISAWTPLQHASSAFKTVANVVSNSLGLRYDLQTLMRRLRCATEAAYRGFWALLELATVGMCLLAIVEAKEFWKFLIKDSEGDLDITKWAFGQLIAVAVWFPLILKFLYLLVHETYFPDPEHDDSALPRNLSWRLDRSCINFLIGNVRPAWGRAGAGDSQSEDLPMLPRNESTGDHVPNA